MPGLVRDTIWMDASRSLRCARSKRHSIRAAKLWTSFKTWSSRDNAQSRHNSSTSSSVRPLQTSADHQQLFRYTSGRWLYNEALRLAERRVVFDVEKLKNAAAKAVHRPESAVQSISKLAEGGFNRTFELVFEDGLHIIARIPYPSSVPQRYTVASEVATIDFVRSHGLPVPQIYDYAITSDNSVGCEYIIMEKMPGQELGHRWFEFSTSERKSITVEVTKLEALLFAIPLPACGSIYYKRDLKFSDSFIDIPGHGDLCIGPDVSMGWWFDRRSSLNIHRGPFNTLEVVASGAQKELAWLTQFARARYPFDRHLRDLLDYKKSSALEHAMSLQKYLQICAKLVPRADALSRPVIRHPDLQPHNTFVTKDLQICGLIDWQHCSILPLFLQADVPKYWRSPDDGPTLIEKPTLPPDYDLLPEPEKSHAMETFRQRQMNMLYLSGTSRFNPQHIDALLTPGAAFKSRLFRHASAPWEGNNVYLKADLVLASKNWTDLTGSSEKCPIEFEAEDADQTLSLQSQLKAREAEISKVRESIGVGSDGWVPNSEYESAVCRNAHIKQALIDSIDDGSKELSLRHYPFDDHDEQE